MEPNLHWLTSAQEPTSASVAPHTSCWLGIVQDYPFGERKEKALSTMKLNLGM